jgi:hypothetical protein
MDHAHNDWDTLLWKKSLQHYCQFYNTTQFGMFTHLLSGTAYLVHMLEQELEIFQSPSPL